ncbi:MAG: hypothetical protein JKY31_06640 [Rhodobacteraceae bacterium]|nr:hypothetical protein [Paracoccaceae bacterium]
MIFHRSLSVILTLAMLVSSTIASYGGALSAGGQMLVICSDVGERDIMIGADGAEIPMLHNCNDCCVAVALIDVPVTAQPSVGRAAMAVFLSIDHLVLLDIPELFELARGPPILV